MKIKEIDGCWYIVKPNGETICGPISNEFEARRMLESLKKSLVKQAFNLLWV